MLIDLSVTPVADTLWQLSAERRSGDLEVRSGKIVKTVFFDRGRIVFAASNLKKDRLGEALLALGRITQAQFEHASELMRGTRRRRFGEALVQAGVMDGEELGRSLARQIKRIVLSLFDVTEGVASFEERECPIPLEYMVSVSVHQLLYVGIRQLQSRELILAGLGALDRWVTLSAVPPFRFNVRKCGAEELEVLEQAKRRVTLRRLAWSDGELSLARLRGVYALLASGVLEDADKPQGEAQPIVQMETSTFLLSALRHKPELSGRELVRKEVDEELKRSARMDRQAWLRVSQGAPPEELAKAIEEKMERYHALLDAVAGDEGLRTDIELILGRASSMLRLARQSAHVAAGSASANAAPEPAVAPVSAAPVPPRSPAPAVPPPAHAPLPPTSPQPAQAPAATTAAAPTRPTPPPSAASPVAGATSTAPSGTPTPTQVPTPTPAGGVPAARPAPPRPPAHDERIAGQSGFTGRALLEHLTMEAQVRMTVGDYAAAVESYAKLVELVPDEPGARVRLAIAMACYPRTAKGAEREFLEAVRLAPDNADIHYHFGLYYKAMKVRARAVAELRTTLSLNPRHKLARQELEALSPKDSALTTLKKLFR